MKIHNVLIDSIHCYSRSSHPLSSLDSFFLRSFPFRLIRLVSQSKWNCHARRDAGKRKKNRNWTRKRISKSLVVKFSIINIDMKVVKRASANTQKKWRKKEKKASSMDFIRNLLHKAPSLDSWQLRLFLKSLHFFMLKICLPSSLLFCSKHIYIVLPLMFY